MKNLLILSTIFLISCQIIEFRKPNEEEIRQWEYLTTCLETNGLIGAIDTEMPTYIATVKDFNCGWDTTVLECLWKPNIVVINAVILDWPKAHEWFLNYLRHAWKHAILQQLTGDSDWQHKSGWFDTLLRDENGHLYSYKSPCSDFPE